MTADALNYLQAEDVNAFDWQMFIKYYHEHYVRDVHHDTCSPILDSNSHCLYAFDTSAFSCMCDIRSIDCVKESQKITSKHLQHVLTSSSRKIVVMHKFDVDYKPTTSNAAFDVLRIIQKSLIKAFEHINFFDTIAIKFVVDKTQHRVIDIIKNTAFALESKFNNYYHTSSTLYIY